MSGEVWRDIPGMDGYQASDFGNVRSLTRYIAASHNGVAHRRRILGKAMSPRQNRMGYLEIGVRIEGVSIMKRVHQLVCAAFHGPMPTGKECVAHNDGDKLNNAPSNLRYATRAENQQDRKRHEARIITSNKITLEQAREIKRRLNAGERQKDIAASLQTTKGVVQGIALKRSWQHA